MINANAHIAHRIRTTGRRFLRNLAALAVVLWAFASTDLTAQVILNNGAVFSISSGAAVRSDSLVNVSDTLSNNGTLSLSGSLVNSGVAVGNGLYSLGGNWTSSGTFNAGTSTFTFNGSSPQTSTASAFASLTLNNASGLTLSGASSVSALLTLTSGTISLTSDTLTIGTAGSVSRTSGWVAAPLKKYIPAGATARTFEIGSASSYAPVSVAFANVSTPGELAASTTSADHPDIANAGVLSALNANRYWTLAPNGIAFTSYDATVTFVAGDLDGGSVPTSFVVDQYAGGDWLLPVTGTVTSTTTQATGLTSFGDLVTGTPAPTVYTSTAAGGDWNNPATWVGGEVPRYNARVVIATTAGNAVTLNANPPNLRSVTVDAGAILQGGGATSLNLNLANDTNFVVNGTFNASGVTVRLARSSTWAGTGTFNLDALDLNANTLTLAFAGPETLSVSAAGNPFLNTGTLVPGTNSFVRFDGVASQTLDVANLNFNEVIIDNPAGVVANANITSTNVTGSLDAVNGQLDDGGFTVTLAAGQDFVVAAEATYRTAGAAGLPAVSGGGSIILAPTSTVVYYGGAQSITRADYGSLTLQNAGTKAFVSGTTRVAGDLVLSGASADALTNSAVIEFNGTGAQAIAGMAYHALIFTDGGLKTLSAAATAASTTTINVGATFRIAPAGSLRISADILNDGVFKNEGTVTVP